MRYKGQSNIVVDAEYNSGKALVTPFIITISFDHVNYVLDDDVDGEYKNGDPCQTNGPS